MSIAHPYWDIFQLKGWKQWGDDCGEYVQPFCLPRQFSSDDCEECVQPFSDDCGEYVQPFCLLRHFSSGTSLHWHSYSVGTRPNWELDFNDGHFF